MIQAQEQNLGKGVAGSLGLGPYQNGSDPDVFLVEASVFGKQRKAVAILRSADMYCKEQLLPFLTLIFGLLVSKQAVV